MAASHCAVLCLVAQLQTLCDPMDCSLPGSSVHGLLQARILEWVAFPFFRGSSQPEIEPRSPTVQANFLPSESPGKPKYTGVGSLTFLQGIFLTQESNQRHLHYGQILYHLSYQRSPASHYLFIHGSIYMSMEASKVASIHSWKLLPQSNWLPIKK